MNWIRGDSKRRSKRQNGKRTLPYPSHSSQTPWNPTLKKQNARLSQKQSSWFLDLRKEILKVSCLFLKLNDFCLFLSLVSFFSLDSLFFWSPEPLTMSLFFRTSSVCLLTRTGEWCVFAWLNSRWQEMKTLYLTNWLLYLINPIGIIFQFLSLQRLVKTHESSSAFSLLLFYHCYSFRPFSALKKNKLISIYKRTRWNNVILAGKEISQPK